MGIGLAALAVRFPYINQRTVKYFIARLAIQKRKTTMAFTDYVKHARFSSRANDIFKEQLMPCIYIYTFIYIYIYIIYIINYEKRLIQLHNLYPYCNNTS